MAWLGLAWLGSFVMIWSIQKWYSQENSRFYMKKEPTVTEMKQHPTKTKNSNTKTARAIMNNPAKMVIAA
ncbi:hypothetical protein, partial [Salmonella enterica]|uniref:hypothetical protein n=1 Tax=Salmonella enterica TaxID=28901 RepID=UPI001F452E51